MPSPPSRDRSASPAREPPAKKSKSSSGGFKWKEKRPRDDDRPSDDRRDKNSTRYERGYRDRDDRYDRDDRRAPRSDRRDYDDDDRYSRPRAQSPRRDRSSGGGGGDRWRPSDDGRDGRRNNDRDRRDDRDDYGERRPPPPGRNADDRRHERKEDRKPAKKDKPAPAPQSGEPMIVVNVNDRLGTKAAIPCLASDSIKAFKAVVAAHIGRKPHEILLKRQGERPFKDQLTLEDYGVSNGVQLDLELDTGD